MGNTWILIDYMNTQILFHFTNNTNLCLSLSNVCLARQQHEVGTARCGGSKEGLSMPGVRSILASFMLDLAVLFIIWRLIIVGA